ncbi:DoxX-like family protein [Nonlabens sp. Hel1_33_55]|uniref:DoxX family protein n=1 Tax=Nonlabens sp. Hel1_33_55 TaxID=1336802 RepID=UPI000875CB6D|nr:DoxX family protein [Nonlabens sp. Hel1_33_55]SCY03837.1 DoxX-like family protein [Nonlabens sp. Hel1_33_55]
MSVLSLLIYFSGIAFLFFGVTCLLTPRMKLEFTRFGLSTIQRQITGVLQIAGSIGLLLFTYSLLIAAISAAGLSILMLLGFITRMRIKDSVYESSPAFIFMILNGIIAYKLWILI